MWFPILPTKHDPSTFTNNSFITTDLKSIVLYYPKFYNLKKCTLISVSVVRNLGVTYLGVSSLGFLTEVASAISWSCLYLKTQLGLEKLLSSSFMWLLASLRFSWLLGGGLHFSLHPSVSKCFLHLCRI